MVVVLSDRGIEEAIKIGEIQVSNQERVLSREAPLLQPASLDLVLDADQRDRTTEPLPLLERLSNMPYADPLQHHPEVGSNFVTFWPGFATKSKLDTVLRYQSSLEPILEIRSTMRRHGLDKLLQGGNTPENHSSVVIHNMVDFPVSVEIGSKLCQAIWKRKNEERKAAQVRDLNPGEGYIVTKDEEIHALVQSGEIYIDGRTAMVQDGMLCFYAGTREARNKSRHVIITKDNRKHGVEMTYDEKDTHIFNAGEFIEIETNRKMGLSGRVAIQVQSLPEDGEVRGVGWIDPGYQGPFSIQPKTYEPEKHIKAGQLVAVGRVMFFPHGVRRAYGSTEVGSQYHKPVGPRQLMLFGSLQDSGSKSE